jgi:hypothetical protein
MRQSKAGPVLEDTGSPSEEEMLKWMCVAAASLALATPAFAQKTDLPDRPAKQTNQFDVSAMKEGNAVLKQNGSCTAQYIVSAEGKAKDVTVDCTHPEMGAYVARTIETGVWDPEIFEGEFFDSYPMRQMFNYGTGAAGPDPRGEKAPVLETGIEPRDIQRVLKEIDKEGSCDLRYTVGADGSPKDIAPNCTPEDYNAKITEIVAKMVFVPGQKGGAPTDWPGMAMPLKLSAPQ